MTTTWQKRMKTDLEAGSYAPRTCDHYVRCAVRFVDRFRRAPEQLGQQQIRVYFDGARKGEKRGPSWLELHMAGVRFLYAVTLGRPQDVSWMRWPRVSAPPPVILSGQEIVALLRAISSPLYRAVSMAMYGAGLRITEACKLEVGDIDSRRGVIHVVGKDGRRRYVMLSGRCSTRSVRTGRESTAAAVSVPRSRCAEADRRALGARAQCTVHCAWPEVWTCPNLFTDRSRCRLER